MLSLNHKIPPPLIGALVAAAMWWAADWGPHFFIPAAIKYPVIVLLVLAGACFDVMGILAFRARRTTINPLRPERASAMVTHGIYRISRNPMYVGMVLFLSSWAIYLSALLPLLGPLAFVLYITRFQIVPEERTLQALFGDEYTAYAAKVRRWL